jgi:hypothetical protein
VNGFGDVIINETKQRHKYVRVGTSHVIGTVGGKVKQVYFTKKFLLTIVKRARVI